MALIKGYLHKSMRPSNTKGEKMKRAFTMIELIFVIVIVGILAAVAIPMLSATRDDATAARCATDASTALSDILSYSLAKGEFDGNFSKMTAVQLQDGNLLAKDKKCIKFAFDKQNELLIVSPGEDNASGICKTILNDTAAKSLIKSYKLGNMEVVQ